ncbi:hypothetical protein GEV33_002591 [Tenebrio molitor]|uniref:Uncharacterized protein n=1 Tax=Tenebrio molitor TaxID=7067 RepID=A0A8J6HT12_TENMO|nr:hypothetical protein GEV33_002591 [Tenebrio molitor]
MMNGREISVVLVERRRFCESEGDSCESAQVPGAEHQSTVLGDAPTAGILIKQGVRADLHYNPSTPSSRTTGAQYTSTIGAHSLPRSYRHFCRHTYHLIIFPHYRFKSAGLSAVDRRAGCGGGFLAIFRGRDRRSRLKWGGLSGVSLPGANLSSNVADDRFDLHARMKPRRETTDPGRVANVSRNPRPSRSTPQPPFAAHTNHSTLPYVKTDITNRKSDVKGVEKTERRGRNVMCFVSFIP